MSLNKFSEIERCAINDIYRNKYFVERGILWYADYKLVVPSVVQAPILDYFHANNYMYHQGAKRMKNNVKTRFYWWHINQAIDEWCRQCHVCTFTKNTRNTRTSLMQLFPATRPFEMVAIDIVTLSETVRGFRYCLTFVDRFSRYTLAVAMKDMNATTVASAFIQNWLYRFGAPTKLLTDRGKQFKSELASALASVFGYKHQFTAAYTPQTNGMIERWHRFLKERIKIKQQQFGWNSTKRNSWPEFLPSICFAYNSTANRMTGYAPNEIVFGQAPVLPIDVSLRLTDVHQRSQGKTVREYMAKLMEHREHVFSSANATQRSYDESRKRDYDIKRRRVVR